ncbi:MAG: sialidase family protein [Planctomycetota bacterium]|nr:sialidase family protein [Planctomycetota bacterium]
MNAPHQKFLIPALLAGISCATAQSQYPESPRARVQLDSGAITASTPGFGGWKITAPRQILAGDPSQGLEPTARVVYAIWPDADASGNVTLRFLRSIDGGWSWDQSRAVDIWTADTAAGETYDTQNLTLVASNHKVFVVLTADRDPNGAPDAEANDSAWVLGSDDQGQTWQAINVSPGLYTPLSNGVDFNDVDEPCAAIGSGDRLHVGYEADYDDTGAGATSTAEDLYYQAVEFDASGDLVAVFAEARQVNGTAPATADVDRPSCAADGDDLIFVWHDPRVNGGDIDDTFTRISNDNGATLGAEFNHTNVTAEESEDRSIALVHAGTILVIQEDGRLGSPDRIWGSLSTDAGANWTTGILLSKGPSTVDVDAFSAAVSTNGTMLIAYTDDREGTGNVDNDVYVIVDTNGGQDFVAGTHVETLLTTGADNDTAFDCAAYGNVLAVTAETSSFPEDAAVFVSSDNGATWDGFQLAGGQQADVDDVYVAVTANRDVQAIWVDDGNLGNTENRVYTAGLRAPRLEDRSATGEGIVYVGGSPEDVGNGLVMFPSFSAPLSNGLQLTLFAQNVDPGVGYNFTLDAASGACFENLVAFYTQIDAQGEARFPLLPSVNWSQLAGQPVYWLGVTFTPRVSGSFDRAFTDPLRQN